MSPTTWKQDVRLGGLRRFAIAITVLNILGHTVLGFEQAWLHPFVSLAAAYGTEILIELADAIAHRRPPRFLGGMRKLIDFMLSAHITGLAVAMLIYPNAQFWVVAFGASVAIASKHLLRMSLDTGKRHFLNPSNFGITATLLAFPWVGVAQPYQFTENLVNAWDFVPVGIILFTGTFLNFRFTKRLPLIFAWLTGFALQAFIRSAYFDTPFLAGLGPMTGVAFVLYTFYMVTDPATTPDDPKNQMLFGYSVAFVYALLMVFHVVYGLFFALTIVCVVRGLSIALNNALKASRQEPATAQSSAMFTGGKDR
ncbi:MAG: RnfABCDGE type electron transport complex subunit D [Armatimonadetes bacterium]|nr:RnfABCDGE type electron transport complex subunit D [Armatimonadota bacterium]